MSDVSRLRWRCRRGMKELDVLLEGYLENKYGRSPPAEQRAFTNLLELPDPTLLALIMGRVTPESEEQGRVISALRYASGS